MSKTSTPPPVRIYILWHPGLDRREEFRGRDLKTLSPVETARHLRGLSLARRLYYWFRLENMEGIPVYFRSAPEKVGESETPPGIPPDEGVHNYIIPLVDDNMVASPDWRDYVAQYAGKDSKPRAGSKKSNSIGAATYRLLPVALESVAYNMPESMRKLNFIRHITPDGKAADDGELIARITEVICRDMRNLVHTADGKTPPANSAPPEKIKIFLSHAKADDTQEAIALKQYIQRETQCEAFFDETDIASGYDYTKILQEAISRESAGLIVIQGDNYADRPWCRKEIRDFLRPALPKNIEGAKRSVFYVPPAVVVQTMKGKQIGRTIPELGYSPCVRWQSDHARFVVTTLLREILFGLFYRKLAERVALMPGNSAKVFINRSPDPVMMSRIMADKAIQGLKKGKRPPKDFVHPGYGLSKMEMDGLKECFPHCTFESLSEQRRQRRGTKKNLSLSGRIVAISVGNSDDILSRGLWDEHTQELVIRLARPLLGGQASLLYGGRLPESFRPADPWKESLNFTSALLQLLISERNPNPKQADEIARLYVPVPSYDLKDLTAQKIAQWTDVCTFVKTPPEGIQSLLEPVRPLPLRADELELLNPTERRKLTEERRGQMDAYDDTVLALRSWAMSSMRQKICGWNGKLTYLLPDSNGAGKRELETFAHILLGGKLLGFSGSMPGIFEEAWYAFKMRKPVFLISAAGGAGALLASWLVNPPTERPVELQVEYYTHNRNPRAMEYARMCKGYQHLASIGELSETPAAVLEQLWMLVRDVPRSGRLDEFFCNGLSDVDNRDLLRAVHTREICSLVWKGIGNLAGAGTSKA